MRASSTSFGQPWFRTIRRDTRLQRQSRSTSEATLNVTGEPVVLEDHVQRHKFVLERYRSTMRYYWGSSNHNKRAFKWTRLATIVLGSAVTLLASMSSTELIGADSAWRTVIAVGTPVFAAVLTILGAIAQTFQWEAAWRESVMTAERLQKEADRILVTKPSDLDARAELDRLNDFVLHESEGFFDRVLGRSKPPVE